MSREKFKELWLFGDARRINTAARVGYGTSCKFPTKTGAVQWPITHSFSMDCFVGGLGRKPQRHRPRSLLLATRGRLARASPAAAAAAATSLTTVLARRAACFGMQQQRR
jgi:hypothetical protein